MIVVLAPIDIGQGRAGQGILATRKSIIGRFVPTPVLSPHGERPTHYVTESRLRRRECRRGMAYGDDIRRAVFAAKDFSKVTVLAPYVSP